MNSNKPPNISLELTGLSWSFAGLEQVAAEVDGRKLAAWAALQLSSDRWVAKQVSPKKHGRWLDLLHNNFHDI